MLNPVGDFIQTQRYNMEGLIGLTNLRDAIEIKIGKYQIKNYKGLSLKYEIDSACAAVSFNTTFNPDDSEAREALEPYTEEIIDITYLGTTFLNGPIDIITPVESDQGIEVNVQARSKLSIYVDSDAIGDLYFRKLTLQQFANKLIRESSTDSAIFDPPGDPIPVIKVDKGEKLFQAVAKEAASRGYWCLPAIAGNCTFKKISSSDPVQAELESNTDPVLSVRASYDKSKRFSEYLIIGSGNGGSRSATVLDSKTKFRRKLIQASKENTDLLAYGERARNQDQIDSMTLEVVLSSWFYKGNLWQPGGMIQLYAPNAMIYKPSKFVIKSVILTLDETNGEQCVISLALPNAFDGSTIKDEPWKLSESSAINGLINRFKKAVA